MRREVGRQATSSVRAIDGQVAFAADGGLPLPYQVLSELTGTCEDAAQTHAMLSAIDRLHSGLATRSGTRRARRRFQDQDTQV